MTDERMERLRSELHAFNKLNPASSLMQRGGKFYINSNGNKTYLSSNQ
ncbi:hypothetical protein [Spirosoma pollinicola]|nr:hypothetical protein [Spirosoma pollinicola]